LQIVQPNAGAFYYLDGNGKLNLIYAPAGWNGNVWTGSGELPGPPAVSGSPLAGYVDSAGNTYLLYSLGNNMEVVSAINGVWQANDLSVANGTAAAVSQIVQPGGNAFYYLDGNGKLNGIYAP